MAAVARSDGGSSSRRQHRVALFTAYTSDYTLGELCARVNRAYACRHRYGWICQVREARSGGADLAARHPTWDKVQLVLELMEGLLDGGSPHGLCPRTTHLMWIDADAVVLRQDRRVEEILDSLPDGFELVIGEDVSRACLINAGVWIAAVSQWSLELWRDVWSSPASMPLWWRPFHEQTALIRELELRRQRMRRLPVFHSFCGGPSLKLFDHVAVLPRAAFNTNRGDVRARIGRCTGTREAGRARGAPLFECLSDALGAGAPVDAVGGGWLQDTEAARTTRGADIDWLSWQGLALLRPEPGGITCLELGEVTFPARRRAHRSQYRAEAAAGGRGGQGVDRVEKPDGAAALRPERAPVGGRRCRDACANRDPRVDLECEACMAAGAACHFIFHAAGRPIVLSDADPKGLRRISKEQALTTMIRHAGLEELIQPSDAPASEDAHRAPASSSRLPSHATRSIGRGGDQVSLECIDAIILATRKGSL